MEIIWTNIARITYLEILENLQKIWTLKEIQAFHQLTQRNLSLISSGKIFNPSIHANSEIRRVVIHRNVTLYYKVVKSKNCIYLITFFNNRMNPAILK